MVGLELLTVFVGVTLAFLFDSYRQGAADKRRQHQLERALVHDIAVFDSASSGYARYLREGFARFDSLRAAGQRPVPFYLRIEGAERPPTDVWQAAMQSGAGELLDPEVIIQLASFYNEIGGEATRYERYALFTEEKIFPLLESDTTAFYDSSGALKPEFKGHMRQLREIMTDLETQTARARTLHTDLARRVKQ